MILSKTNIGGLVVMLVAGAAMAQSDRRTDRRNRTSQTDIMPAPPSPVDDQADHITQKAGGGGEHAYASAGVLELGGTASLTAASGLTQFSLSPSVGWFFADNLQLSGIMSWIFSTTDGNSEHLFSFLAEPSYHYPLTKLDFIFLGVGAGLSYQSSSKSGGLALAPRLGYQRLVGRSGLLTAALQTTYSGNDRIRTSNGTLLSVQTATSLGLGFSVLW